MKGTLIVITFDQSSRAETVFEALQLMRRRALYSLDEALVVTRNRQGQVRLHHTHSLANTKKPDTLDVLVRLILDHEGDQEDGRLAQTEIMTDLANTGFDAKFLEIVGRSLQKESSAIFFLVKRTSLGDAEEIVKVLSQFQGDIAHTTITAESETYLNQLTA
jgi:uncharacterized membrane protein